MQTSKYDIVLANLNPAIGSEQKGTRPCLVVQTNASKNSRTVAVCPITKVIKYFPSSLVINKSKINNLDLTSRIDILQIKTIDKMRIRKKIGILDPIYKEAFREKFNISFDLDDMFEKF